MASLKNVFHTENYLLENGVLLPKVQVTYHTYGKLNPKQDNCIWVCHALTGDSDVYAWWPGLFGDDQLFNPENYFIICANVLGSPYGTTNPLSQNPETNRQYHHDFPAFTIRDIVGLHKRLADDLSIHKIELLIGGSMGGYQALEWAIMEPQRFNNLALIASSAIHSAWGIAFNASQRMAIASDSTWTLYDDDAGINGMKVARSVALLSYRNYRIYKKTQKEKDNNYVFPQQAVSYQSYQGDKLALRFNAFSYWTLSRAMDSMNVGRDRGGSVNALSQVAAKTIVISMEDDVLFPRTDQEFLAAHIHNATFMEVETDYGHDGFLVETDQLSKILKDFLYADSFKVTSLSPVDVTAS